MVWNLFCGAGVLYEPRLAKHSTACGVMSTVKKSVFVPCLLMLMGYGGGSRTRMEPYLHQVRRNALPPPLAGLYPPPASLALPSSQKINHTPVRIDYCHNFMRGSVDPREKSVVVPGLSVFMKRVYRTIYPLVVVLPLCPSSSQSAVSEYGWGFASCGAVSTLTLIVTVLAFVDL